METFRLNGPIVKRFVHPTESRNLSRSGSVA